MLCIRDYDNDIFFQVHYMNFLINHYLKRSLYLTKLSVGERNRTETVAGTERKLYLDPDI